MFEILYQCKIDFANVTSEIDFLLICFKSLYFYLYHILRDLIKYQNRSITKRIESFDLFLTVSIVIDTVFFLNNVELWD